MSNSVATCAQPDGWSYNSRGQSPCHVALNLARVCVSTYNLPPLEPEYEYAGPGPAAANSCRCSSIYYSMLSACSECQERTWVTWSEYTFNCTEVYLQVFPHPIPSGIAVPHWAYLNVSRTDSFSVSLAQDATGPESSLPSAPPTDPKKKTNIGAIVGGAVGGVVFLALVGLVVFFLLRRRGQKKVPPSQVYMQSTGGPGSTIVSTGPATSNYGSNYNAAPPPKLYDPNDPSTWPTERDPLRIGTPPPTAPPQSNTFPQHTGQSGGSGNTGYTQPAGTYQQGLAAPVYPQAQGGGRYTGIPEV